LAGLQAQQQPWEENAMDRRDFLKSATLATAATAASAATAALPVEAAPGPVQVAQAATHVGAPQVRRFTEQRWLLDNIIRANGIDWDQPRSVYLSAPMGGEAAADFAAIRARVQKYADCSPAFEAVAKRREALAKTAEGANALVTARDNYFMAAIHWGAAQWPIDENNAQNIAFNQRKRECYSSYVRLADHRIEEVWIPLPNGQKLPAWFHLPPNYQGGRIPAIVAIPGMDSMKEGGVALYGDRWLNRGIAVLSVDGPGQYESPVLGIYFSMPAWADTGRALADFLAARPEVDMQRVGVTGTSFGSLFATIVAGAEPRFRAVAVSSTCLEPGCHTIFEEASPTFKMRFMYMSGITDEAKFDEFRKSITWEGYAEKIRSPYLCLAGEADELSPLEHADRMFKTMQAPRNLVVYQDSRHSVGGVPAANLGPNPLILMADFMAARFAGAPLTSERWYVSASGQVAKTPL
jgi:dienelactone hydrolase